MHARTPTFRKPLSMFVTANKKIIVQGEKNQQSEAIACCALIDITSP